MNLQLRALAPDDLPLLNELARELHAHHVAGVPYVFQMPDGPIFERDWIEEMAGKPDHLLLGALDGSALVGFLYAFIREWEDNPQQVPRRWLVVEMVGVTAGYRSQGIGETLMAEVEMWARDRGILAVTLGVWAFNTGAIRFYERLGYETELVWMRKELTDL